MSNLKFVSVLVLVLLTLLLSAALGAVVTQASSPGDPGARAIVNTITLPENHRAYDYADAVRRAGDHGYDDYWGIFYSESYELPVGVWANNGINQKHIQLNGHKLDGYFYCHSNDCTTYLCSKHGWGSQRLAHGSEVVRHA